MAHVQTQRLRAGYPSVRKGNRKAKVSYWDKGHRFFLAFSMALVFVGFALVFVWSNYQGVQTGYVIASLHQEQTRLIDLRRKLKLELANLTSLDRLEKAAKSRLGLITPKPDQVQVIE